MIRILIVDDVESMRALVETLLQGLSGVQISASVGSIREAQLELTRKRPDLVLLDEVLPGESSSGFLEALHQERIPTLLMTSMEEPKHLLPVEARGRLTKPSWRSLSEDQKRFDAEIRKIFENNGVSRPETYKSS